MLQKFSKFPTPFVSSVCNLKTDSIISKNNYDITLKTRKLTVHVLFQSIYRQLLHICNPRLQFVYSSKNFYGGGISINDNLQTL